MEQTADIYIYSTIKGDSYSWWDGEVKSETSANTFREKLQEVGDVKNINVYINSEGGSCYEGNAIYSMLQRHSAYKTAYIDGFACSEASIIPMACDKIVMSDNSLMVIHNPWLVACGNAEELRKTADDLDVMASAFRQAYLKRFNQGEEKLIELLDNETYLTATQCIEYGLADEIAGVELPSQPTVEQVETPKDEPTQKIPVKDIYSVEHLKRLFSLSSVQN
jgi:ATP-dependent protease ClpP protease subunit